MTTQEEIRRQYGVDKKKINIVIFGQPGAGKSSLINALCGEVKAQTSNRTDTTVEAQIIEQGKVVFIDLPGYGTSRFPKETYFEIFNPLQYDLFICVFEGKLHEADTEFFRLIQQEKKPCIFVRSKADLIYNEGLTREESYAQIKKDLEAQMGAQLPLVFISTRKGKIQGLEELNNLITDNMDAAREEKYRMAVRSYTAAELGKKKDACLTYVGRYAKVAAANGFNPLLGIDIAVDVAILYTMYGTIRWAFGISNKEIENSSTKPQTKNLILKGMTKQGILYILKNAMLRIAAKTALKVVPILGNAASAYLGHYIIKKAGEHYVEACYQVGQELLYQELHIEK